MARISTAATKAGVDLTMPESCAREMTELQTVLVVDDDPDILGLAELCLRHGGIDAHTCLSGGEALAYLEEQRPQMVVIDVMMPELDGPATIRELWRRIPEYRPCLVFLTGKVQQQTRDELLGMGADAVLRKPFTPLTFVEQLRELYAD